jgi:tripartite-type tricarboxylate transporter receptor subunit TctC
MTTFEQTLTDRRTVLRQIGAATVAAACLPLAMAADQLQVVVSYPVGGVTDVLGRMFAEYAGKELGANAFVINRPGAAGVIGAQLVARSPRDGAMVGVGGFGLNVILPLTKKDIPFDPIRDLDLVGVLGGFGNLLLAHPDAPFNTLPELVAHSKAKGGVNCGIPPIGSPTHLMLEYLIQASGIQANGITYQGDAPTITDILGGHLAIGLVTLPGASAQITAGKIKVIAITTARRSERLPNVPTVQEQGFKDFDAALWTGLVIRGGTPEQTQAAINAAINRNFVTSAVKSRLVNLGVEFTSMDLQQTRFFLQAERSKWKAIADRSGIVPT